MDIYILKRSNNLFVLCYHGVSDDDWRFGVSMDRLIKQINYLKKHFKFLTLSEFESVVKGEKKLKHPSVLLTFDDGYKNILQTKSYFKKENIKPVLFVLSNSKHVNRKELETNSELLTFKQIKQLQSAGWSIGCHSATHSDFSTLSDYLVKEEVIYAKKKLEKELKTAITHFAYPKGNYSKSIFSALKKANYSLAFSMDDGFISRNTKPYLIPRFGVNRTHSLLEFKALSSPSVVTTRNFIKTKLGVSI